MIFKLKSPVVVFGGTLQVESPVVLFLGGHLPSLYSSDASLIRQYFRIDLMNIVDVNVRGQVEQARKNKPTINQHVATVLIT